MRAAIMMDCTCVAIIVYMHGCMWVCFLIDCCAIIYIVHMYVYVQLMLDIHTVIVELG